MLAAFFFKRSKADGEGEARRKGRRREKARELIAERVVGSGRLKPEQLA